MTFLLSLLFSFSASAQQELKLTTPKIGANLLGIYRRGSAVSDDRNVVPHNGFALQEAEIVFTADVDAYLRAFITLAIVQEAGAPEYVAEPEDAYVETISIPHATIRAGKFKMALGKQNTLHTHALPFVDAPLIHQELLGDEGLNEEGVGINALIPLPWFSEVTLQAFDAGNDALYGSLHSGNQAGLLALRNLWDWSDDLTIELGLSGSLGQNQYERLSSVFAADFTLKWRPAEGGKYRAFVWSTEYLQGRRPGLVDASAKPIENLGGLATWVQYQFAQRWWVQGRYEYFGLPHSDAISVVDKQSVLLGLFPTEFSGLRLQFDRLRDHQDDSADQTISLQYIVAIGAHPAHSY